MLSRQDKIALVISHAVLITASVACIIPFVVMLSASITEEKYLITNGYGFFPV
jgi:putative aldouronate transport system permease protein